ncbi:MAG: hypothetical protein NTW93_05110 [Phycisphaerae bacterium]|nr:hypothetical protein [Phycisphaerae bacterium]
MRKTNISRIAALLVIFSFCLPAFAVSTAKIDVVRSKETLADSDTEVIEGFLGDAFKEFLAKIDFSDISSLRNIIVSRGTSELASGQIQYGPRFMTAAQKQVSQAFNKASQMPDGQRKQVLTMNLLVLVNDLNSIEISKEAFGYLQNPDVMVRYWAVNCLTNANMVRQLNMTESAENSQLAEEIAQKLLSAAKTEQSGDIQILLAQFAAGLKRPAANEILKEIAQKRIDLYLNWQVKDEMTESWILKALSDRVQADRESISIMAKNFATLYSLVIQRYLLGQDTLPADNMRNLVSTIVQSEKYLLVFIPDWPGNLKGAIEKGGGSTLQAQHDSLFGSSNTTGKLPTAANFDYGKNPDGSVKTAPPTLKKPPATEKQVQTTMKIEPNQPEETIAEPNQ